MHVLQVDRQLRCTNSAVLTNAVSILVNAFHVDDPNAMGEEIVSTRDFQCSKLLVLLLDPSYTVHCVATEGVCRVLGFLWNVFLN